MFGSVLNDMYNLIIAFLCMRTVRTYLEELRYNGSSFIPWKIKFGYTSLLHLPKDFHNASLSRPAG